MSEEIPKFGLLTNPAIDIVKEIKIIHRLGFDYPEIGIEGPAGKPEIILQKKKAILGLIKKFKTNAAIAHTSYWIDLGSDYEPVREGWIKESKKIIDIASQLNLKFVNFHSGFKGFYTNKMKKIILRNWVRSLNELSKYSRRKGITIILENVPKQSGLSSSRDLKYIFDRAKNIKLHFDVPHAFTDGGMKEVVSYIRTFKKKIAHVHWHDNHGVYDEHLPIGKGLIDHEKVVRELKKIDYDKTITIEVFTSKADAKKSMVNLINMWKKV